LQAITLPHLAKLNGHKLASKLLIVSLAISLNAAPSGAGYASITNTRTDPWNTVEVQADGWLGKSGVQIFGNGATVTGPSPDTTATVSVNGSSVNSGIEWQCVELINRLYLNQRWTTATWSGNGSQMYANAPSSLLKEASTAISYLSPGDVIGFSGNTFGHVGIVNSVTKSGSDYNIGIASQNTDAVYSSAVLSGTSLTSLVNLSGLSVNGVIHAPTRNMLIDGSGHAFSQDFLGTSWTAQFTDRTITQIAVGGTGRMMALDSNGTAYSKVWPAAGWETEVTGAKAIAVGGNGRMMVINSADNVYATETSHYWTQETTLGGIIKIAVGGNGRQMIIDNSNTAHYNDSIANSWTSEVTGAKAIAVGGNGRMMVINSADNVYATDVSHGWTQETTLGGIIKIAGGYKGRQMIIDNSNSAYFEDSIANSWSSAFTSNAASDIKVGSNGRMMVIDTTGKAWAKDPTGSWVGLTSGAGAAQISTNLN
jgi:CHAP domain